MSIGASLAGIGSGLTGGILEGMKLKQQQNVQNQTLAIEKQKASQMEAMGTIQQAQQLAASGNVDAATGVWNQYAQKTGAPTITHWKPTNNGFQAITADGKLIVFNKQSGQYQTADLGGQWKPVAGTGQNGQPLMFSNPQGQVKTGLDQSGKPVIGAGGKPNIGEAAVQAQEQKLGRPLTAQERFDTLKNAQVQVAQARYQAPLSVGMVKNPDTSLTGMDALKNYTPEVQTRAQKLLRGQVPYPTGYLQARDPTWRAAIDAAQAVDPGWNAQKYQITEQVRKSFTSGKDAQNVTSINTLVGHLGALEKSAEGLGNTGFSVYNRAGNWLQTETGNPKVTKFNMDLGAVESEMANVFKGTGASDQEIQAWRSRLDSSQSPAQLKDNIKEAVDLMASRLSALQEKYKKGMGIFAGDLQILSPKSRKILAGIVGQEAVDALEPTKAAGSKQRGQAPSGGASRQPRGVQVNPVTHQPMHFNPNTMRWENADGPAS